MVSELKDRVCTLVDYLIEHNREHEEELRHWAEKAASLQGEVARWLLEAAARMAAATACLERARQALEGEKSN